MMLVTVLLPVYNAEKYLREAIDSILCQTFKDFELLAINDGSTDSSSGILASYNDKRLRIINNVENKGLIYTLNRGIEEARGKYIARMDADDIAMPDRLDIQVKFLEQNPSIALVGGYAKVIDEYGIEIGKLKPPWQYKAILEEIFYGSTFVHPSVMYNTNIIRDLGGYSYDAPHAEDYELWLRLILCYKAENIPKVLVQYRIHAGQVSQTQLVAQRKTADRVRERALKNYEEKNGKLPFDINIRKNLWQRLRGQTPSIGSDYLSWISRYRAMGAHQTANGLAFSAVFAAPFSGTAYKQVFFPIFNSKKYKSIKQRLRWYSHKLHSLLK